MINKLITLGVLPSEGRIHRHIPLVAMEELIGEPISVERWLLAQTVLAPHRATQRRYNDGRR